MPEDTCPCPHGFRDMLPELHPDECDDCPFLGMMRSMASVICRADEPNHPAHRKGRNHK